MNEEQMDAERRRWRNVRRLRPADDEIVVPGPGQESVWDYPRPPRLDSVAQRVRVEHRGITIADTMKALRVLETASPPTYYLPPADVATQYLVPGRGQSFCEWKGVAEYWDLALEGAEVSQVAWRYPNPDQAFEDLRGYFAFYAGRVEACWVGEERVRPQPGEFYGGWITDSVVGPFKGEPGTQGW
jgi:uncharacterized protein (DUF427 family)